MYLDYINSLVDVIKLTNKDNSIMINFKISNNKCVCKVDVVDHDDGEKKKFDDIEFECNDNFYNEFLPLVVEKLYNNSEIIIKDIVNLDGDEFVALRMITEYNDLFSIDGLEKEVAEKLLELI